MSKFQRISQHIVSLILVCLFTLQTGEVYATSAVKSNSKILVIHSYASDYPAYPGFNKMLADNLKKEGINGEIRTFYLDCEQYLEKEEIERMYNYIDTIQKWKPDVIMVNEDQGTYSLLASGHPFLQTVPIVFTGVNFPNKQVLKHYPNVTGLWDKPDYLKTADMIERMLGKTRIRYFYDKTYLGRQVLAEMASQFNGRDEKTAQILERYLLQNDSTIEKLNLKEILKDTKLRFMRPDETGFYFTNIRKEAGGDVLWTICGMVKYSVFVMTKYDYTTMRIGRIAAIPTFSVISEGFGYNHGILGGYFTTIETQAKEGSHYLARILKGESPAELPIIESAKTYTIDWEEMQRWDIPYENIPPGYEIINMPFYVRYHTVVIVFLSLVLASILSVIIYLAFLYIRELKRKREAQLNLRREKEFLSLALEGSNIFAWKYDQANEVFIFDKEFFDKLNIEPFTINVDQIIKMTHPDEVQQALETFQRVENKEIEKAFIRSRTDFNGEGYVWYEFRYINVAGSLGAGSSIIGLILNIQDYKDKEIELTEAKDLAAKAELKQSFLANMSHEIRTPLNAIVGFANLLVDGEDLSDQEKLDFITTINNNCELLLKLINDILEISRIESGNMTFSIETCDLNNLIEDIYRTQTLMMPSGVQLLKELPPHPVIADTDATRLNQVITNFINNAIKFTSSGHILIGLHTNAANKELSLFVEDTGKGIPAAEQKMIFERFYKQDEFVQGTGLGLSISRVIAEKLGGKITLWSEEGKGSRFTIILPYSTKLQNKQEVKKGQAEKTAQLAAARVKSLSVGQPNEGKPTILIAEDNESNYMLLNSILKKHYNLIWVMNGRDAVDTVNNHPVSLVLMDVKMPIMDGIEALKEIRKNFKDLPVIMQTAYAFEADKKIAAEAGCSDFISKPIMPNKLMQVIGRFISVPEN